MCIRDRLLAELAAVPDAERTARFVCTLVFIDEDGTESVARDVYKRQVITPRGASIPTQFLGSLSPEHACVGMGIVVGGVPCYFDCANEAGRCV